MGLSYDFLSKLMAVGVLKKFKKGEVVIHEEAYLQSIPIVLKGALKIVRSDDDGRNFYLYHIENQETCILSFLGGIHHEPSKIKAIADEPSEIIFVSINQVNLFIKENPEWLEYIFKLYHKRFEDLLEVVNAMAFKKVDERLHNLLEHKAKLIRCKTIEATHEQLAEDLGTARTVVSRLLKQMEENGVLKLSRNKIELLS